MSEEGAPKGNESNTESFAAITSQADLDRIIGERLGREKAKFADYEDLKAKAAKFDEVEQSSKSELQKAIERAEQAEKQLTPAQVQIARLEVALTKGLTATQAKRLVGTSKEELEKDADELLADLGQTRQQQPRDPKRLQSGSKKSGDDSGLDGKERAAELLKQYRAASH